MEMLIKATSSFGTDERTIETDNFEKTLAEQSQHYKDWGRMDRSLTAYASVVEDGEVTFFKQLA